MPNYKRIFYLFGFSITLSVISCSKPQPEIKEVYWATDENGSNRISPLTDLEWGSLVYACVATENVDTEQIRIVIWEYDAVGYDELCADCYVTIKNNRGSVGWTVGSGDHSWEERRQYYIAAGLGEQIIFSDNIVSDPPGT